MRFLLITFAFLVITSCNYQSSLEEDVCLSIEQTMRRDYPQFEMHSFKLNHISDNYYEGVLRTNELGEVYTYYVDVTLYEDDIFEWEIREDGMNNNTENPVADTPNDYGKSRANLSLKEHITQNTFTVNGNGSATFRFNSNNDEGSIHISGGRASLIGQCEIMNDAIYIENLVAVSGNFDASNNSGSSGMVYLSNDGSLYGSLYDSNGNSRDVQLTIK